MSALKLLDGVKADATISPDGQYRYALTRDWFGGAGRGAVLWIMLNPSSADADEDDPTLRKIQKFSRAWGYDGLIVGNLFGLRSPSPDVLRRHRDPVGDANDLVLESLLDAAGVGLVVAAWGAYSHMRNRDAAVTNRVPLRFWERTETTNGRRTRTHPTTRIGVA